MATRRQRHILLQLEQRSNVFIPPKNTEENDAHGRGLLVDADLLLFDNNAPQTNDA